MALEAQDNPFPYVTLVDTADPSTPAAGTKRLWVDTDDALKIIDESATVSVIGAAAHAASHENGGSDEIDVTGLVGAGTPTEILSIPTAEMDDTLVLAPDGAGGVEFRAETGGGIGFGFAGVTTPGASWAAMVQRRWLLKKFTVAVDTYIPSIEAYLRNENSSADAVEDLSVALFADSAGSPSTVIAYHLNPLDSLLMDPVAAGSGATTGRWVAVALGKIVTAGDYWGGVCQLSARPTNGAQIALDSGTGSDRHFTAGGAWVSDYGFTSPTTTTDSYSIRIPIIS